MDGKVNLDELVARVAELEMAQARQAAAGRMITVTDTGHHPRPGTWTGDSREAVCRYCDQPIWADDLHRWFAGRDEICHVHAAGAPAKD